MEASASSEKARPLQRVVFFGDSRAEWWRLPVQPGFQCLNAGVPGATAPYLARRFMAMVVPLHPDIVVVQMGVNDLVELTGHAPERERLLGAVRAAIASVVAQARALGARVILTTIFPLARGPYAGRAVQEGIAAINPSTAQSFVRATAGSCEPLNPHMLKESCSTAGRLWRFSRRRCR